MRKRVFLCILIGWWGMIHAQLLPPIYNYTPSEYKGESQNWKICQAENKKIYFANNIGLLEFNGVVWQRYPAQWSHCSCRKCQRQHPLYWWFCRVWLLAT